MVYVALTQTMPEPIWIVSDETEEVYVFFRSNFEIRAVGD